MFSSHPPFGGSSAVPVSSSPAVPFHGTHSHGPPYLGPMLLDFATQRAIPLSHIDSEERASFDNTIMNTGRSCCHSLTSTLAHLNRTVKALLQCTDLLAHVIVYAPTAVPFFGLKNGLLVGRVTVRLAKTGVVLEVH